MSGEPGRESPKEADGSTGNGTGVGGAGCSGAACGGSVNPAGGGANPAGASAGAIGGGVNSVGASAGVDAANGSRAGDVAGGLPPVVATASVLAVWFATLLAAILVALLATGQSAGEWLTLTLGACVFASMCVQLATQQKQGFVLRLAASVSGAAIILALTAGIVMLRG